MLQYMSENSCSECVWHWSCELKSTTGAGPVCVWLMGISGRTSLRSQEPGPAGDEKRDGIQWCAWNVVSPRPQLYRWLQRSGLHTEWALFSQYGFLRSRLNCAVPLIGVFVFVFVFAFPNLSPNRNRPPGNEAVLIPLGETGLTSLGQLQRPSQKACLCQKIKLSPRRRTLNVHRGWK